MVGVLRVLLPTLAALVVAEAVVVEVGTVLAMATFAKSILFDVVENWGRIKALMDSKNPDAGMRVIVEGVTRIDREMADLTRMQSGASTATVLDMLAKVSGETQTELKLHELADLVHRVDGLYGRMAEYSEHLEQYERSTVRGFAETCVSHDPSNLQGILERIYSLVVPNDRDGGLVNRGILNEMMKSMKGSDKYICNLQQSVNQLVHGMYDRTLLTQIKGFTLMQFSWMILRIHNVGNFTYEVEASRDRYEEKVDTIVAAVKSVLAEADRAIWRCDPKRHTEGETYERLTGLLQGYIENEIDMNSENTCTDTCWAYNDTVSHGCYKSEFCSRQSPCAGRILWCRFIDSDMKLCLSPRKSTRRYDWIHFDDGTLYGDKKECQRGSQTVESWSRWLFWRCHYCFCLCDQSGPMSDRYVSLRQQISNFENNKVIVGVRFVKVNRIVHIQIREAKLLPGGLVDMTSDNNWRRVPHVDVRKSRKSVDYVEMSTDERSLDLDDIEGPMGHVLIGIGFARTKESHLGLQIKTAPFNITTGELFTDKAQWMGGSDKERKELKIENPDVPTLSRVPSAIDSENRQYLKFTHSSIGRDVAQTTIPFFDAQPVISTRPVPLSGVGVYHKGQKGFGGFVGLRIFTYNYVSHMDKSYYWRMGTPSSSDTVTTALVTNRIDDLDNEVAIDVSSQ